MLGFIFSRLHHCFTVSPDSCLSSSISDQFCSWIFFLSIAVLSMLLPPVGSEGRTADIYRGLVLSLEFSVPDHFSMDFFALRDAGLFGGYVYCYRSFHLHGRLETARSGLLKVQDELADILGINFN